MKCFFGMSDFLEDIASLFHSIFGMVVCPCMLYVHVRMGKKSGRASRYRHAECDSEHGYAPGWEAAQLMYGLSRKDHYKDLPPEVREKSIFGKRD